MPLSVESLSRVKNYVFKAFNKLVKLLGIIMLTGLILSFTNVPFNIYYWLATKGADLTKRPGYIVLLGGVGMPSPDDLMRTYTVSGAWKQVPGSKVIIAFPDDTSLKELSPELLMAKELKMRGVDSTLILFEKEGISTRTQAQNIARMVGDSVLSDIGIRIVTSPEHMFRAVKTFKKLGFKNVGGTPAFENPIHERNLVKDRNNKNQKRFLNFRYNMWSYMKYEITIVREFCAIAYYKLRGWI